MLDTTTTTAAAAAETKAEAYYADDGCKCYRNQVESLL